MEAPSFTFSLKERTTGAQLSTNTFLNEGMDNWGSALHFPNAGVDDGGSPLHIPNEGVEDRDYARHFLNEGADDGAEERNPSPFPLRK